MLQMSSLRPWSGIPWTFGWDENALGYCTSHQEATYNLFMHHMDVFNVAPLECHIGLAVAYRLTSDINLRPPQMSFGIYWDCRSAESAQVR